jgi:4-alpha-glucanotransferase
LDEDCCPVLVAGVPPDYFSETGQLWGNPVYNWQAMEADHFHWWIRRFQGTRELVDILRVDHFRGFEAGWSVPAGETTAINGEWIKAPGMSLFAEVHKQLGDLPILAEDLGLITPEVEFLRDNNNFPGMRILQFAFENAIDLTSIFLPHNHIKNSVVYTGTHDNDTILGWYKRRSDLEKSRIQDYFGHPLTDIAWDFIRVAFASTAQLAIIPMQDALSLPSECRMNTPATSIGNWGWRMEQSATSPELAGRLANLVHTYDR